MSIIGVKINITDISTALSHKMRVILYQGKYPPQSMSQEKAKAMVFASVIEMKIWWSSKPYIQLIMNKEMEKSFLDAFKMNRLDQKTKDFSWYLIDICDRLGEPISKFMRARDLTCYIEGVFVEENLFDKGILVDNI